MNDSDEFFTQTIVGAAFSVPLGQRLTRGQAAQNGLVIDFETGENRLTQAWRDWWVLSHAGDAAGLPRQRPGGLRRWLERHALAVAILGLASLLASALVWGVIFWK
jgi:hypothetical protein